MKKIVAESVDGVNASSIRRFQYTSVTQQSGFVTFDTPFQKLKQFYSVVCFL